MSTASEAWIGSTLFDQDGQSIGEIVEIFADDASGEPKWLAVRSGLFGLRRNFVPVSEVVLDGGGIVARWPKAHVTSSPTAGDDTALTPEEELDLFAHYGLVHDEVPVDDAVALDSEVPAPQAAGEAVTRSEEELQVGKTERVAGRVRLRKWVETETVTETVALQREELRIERQPVTGANVEEAVAGAEISEAEYEFVLHEEQPVVSKVVVPKEHISVDTVTVTEDQDVTADLRKERVDIDRTDGP